MQTKQQKTRLNVILGRTFLGACGTVASSWGGATGFSDSALSDLFVGTIVSLVVAAGACSWIWNVWPCLCHAKQISIQFCSGPRWSFRRAYRAKQLERSAHYSDASWHRHLQRLPRRILDLNHLPWADSLWALDLHGRWVERWARRCCYLCTHGDACQGLVALA